MKFVHQTFSKGMHVALIGSKALAIAGVVAVTSMVGMSNAEAARCASDSSGNWSCTFQERNETYVQSGASKTRHVRWQVPEGTPPAGG